MLEMKRIGAPQRSCRASDYGIQELRAVGRSLMSIALEIGEDYHAEFDCHRELHVLSADRGVSLSTQSWALSPCGKERREIARADDAIGRPHWEQVRGTHAAARSPM